MAELKIVYENGLPLKSFVSLIALGENGNESVVVENIEFNAAEVDSNGRVPNGGTTKDEAFIDLSQDQIYLLEDASKYIYEISMQTANNGQTDVAMFTDYEVKMGVGIKLEIKRD